MGIGMPLKGVQPQRLVELFVPTRPKDVNSVTIVVLK